MFKNQVLCGILYLIIHSALTPTLSGFLVTARAEERESLQLEVSFELVRSLDKSRPNL